MNIIKNRGLNYSEYILGLFGNTFADYTDLGVSVETFYNCREMGYVLRVHDEDDYNKAMCIWVYAQRNSDDPTITWDYISLPQEEANMFNEESYYNRTFSGDITEVGTKAVEVVKDYFD